MPISVRAISLILSVPLFIAGCVASPPKEGYLGIAKEHIESRNWNAAYRFLEDVPKQDVAAAKALMNEHPQIIQAGLGTFSPTALNASIEKYGLLDSYDIESKRLGYLQRYTSEDKYRIAEQQLLDQYDPAEIQRAIDRLSTGEDIIEYGKITDVQTADESIYNTGAGATIGGAYASAAYVDSAFSGKNWDYSALRHTNATLLGAMIGHMIEGNTEIDYHTRYWITLNSGKTISLGSHQVSTFHIPKGACVEVKNHAFMKTANAKFCDKRNSDTP